MITALVVACAGGAGAVTRFLLDAAITRRVRARVPIATLIINITGSLLLGGLSGLAVGLSADGPAAVVTAALGTGFCGGYTTFSTASVEVVRLWVAEGRVIGVGYAVATLVGSVLAAALGMASAQLVLA